MMTDETGKEFDWSDVEDDVVVQTTGAIAVYDNPHGDVVIRQRSTDVYQDEDAFIVVPRLALAKLIRKLERIQEALSANAED